MARPRLWPLTGIFFRAGAFTLGGGNPIQAVLHRELVEERGWIEPREFGLVYGIARFTPGTNVLASSAALAWRIRGWSAAVLAVVAGSLPSAIVITMMLDGYERIRANPSVSAAMGGALAAVVALIVVSSWKIVRPYALEKRWLRIAVLTGGATAAIAGGWLSPIFVLALAVGVGYALDRAGVR